MRYFIRHYKRGAKQENGQSKRLGIADTIEAAVVMGFAMAQRMACTHPHSTENTSMIFVDARRGSDRCFDVHVFICGRDEPEDISAIITKANVALKKWKAEAKLAADRMKWARVNLPGGKYIHDYFHDEQFKTAFFANDFARAGERLKELMEQEVRAVA